MPHIKSAILGAVASANVKLRSASPEVIAGAESLAGLAGDIGLSEGELETVSHLYPEVQDLILHAVQIASARGRPVYVSWRHSAIQRVGFTAPPASASEEAVDILIESRYTNDGLDASDSD
jgi:hypothetical protein